MKRLLAVTVGFLLILSATGEPTFAQPSAVSLKDVPPMPAGTELLESEAKFAYRGRIGGYAMKPSKYGVYYDKKVHIDGSAEGIFVRYRKREDPSFCGVYLIVIGDLSHYATMSFWIKGLRGGETFELGMNDTISNKREDAVLVGSIHRYLPKGVTTQWQQVVVPLEDFFGADLSRVYSIVLNFNEEGEGTFWIDGFSFHTEQLLDRQEEIEKSGELLLDNFDHSDLNLLGRKANAYKRLPSVCTFSRVPGGVSGAVTEGNPRGASDSRSHAPGGVSGAASDSRSHVGDPRVGEEGRSLRLDFDKKSTGWCGYYTLLNQIDGAYFDLSRYKNVSFWVRGLQGGEFFEIGMADKAWLTIGDSVKAGSILRYLPKGVTPTWQQVVIPLADFGKLDWSQMGSFVINFPRPSQGTLFVDNLKFTRKTQEDLLKEWDGS